MIKQKFDLMVTFLNWEKLQVSSCEETVWIDVQVGMLC